MENQHVTELLGPVLLCVLSSYLSGIHTCEEVIVDSRQDKVTLPCIFKNIQGKWGTVRWRFVESDTEVLTLHSHGRQTNGSDYKDRVITIPNRTNTTLNISLILKHPNEADEGRYKCTIQMYTNNMVKEFNNSINLKIAKRHEGEHVFRTATKGDLNVELPCENCIQVAKGTTTWRKVTSESGKVVDSCIYRRFSDGTQDPDCNEAYINRVSLGNKHALVLSSPDVTDTGNYSCTIESECSRITTYVYLTVNSSASIAPTHQYANVGSITDELKNPTEYRDSQSQTNIAIGVGTSCGALAVVIIACLIYRRRRSNGAGTSSEPDMLEVQSTPLNSHGDNEHNTDDKI